MSGSVWSVFDAVVVIGAGRGLFGLLEGGSRGARVTVMRSWSCAISPGDS